MKAIVFGHNVSDGEMLALNAGFQIVKKDPDFVISYGGDGTLMKAEYAYSGIPKIVLKDSAICKVCSSFPNKTVLQKVLEGSYDTKTLMTLDATVKDKTITGMNDIIVHNGDPRHGMRYRLWTNGKQIGNIIIGDGIVVATPFGSTAYYHSITDSFFDIGIGLAFNNSIEQSGHVVLDDQAVIKLEVTRGPAVVYADNQKEYLELKEGEEVAIRQSVKKARWVIVK